MTVLGTLAKRSSLENPNVPISASSIANLFPWGTRSLAGVQVNEQRAYGLTAYYRAIALMASTMALLPINVTRRGSLEPVTVRTVLDNPSQAQTPFEFWQTMYANALGWGNCYAQKLRNGADVVTELVPLHPSFVMVSKVKRSAKFPDGKSFRVTVTDEDGGGIQQTFSSWDIFHMPYLSPYGVTGLPPLRLVKQVLGITIATEETAAHFYGNGARISGILSSKSKLTEPMADRLKERWREKVAGQQNAGDVAVLDMDTTYQPIAIPPQDAQLLESRKFGVVEIARLFGIPPHMLGDVERSTSWGTGIEHQTIGLVKFTVQSWTTMGEQRITRELLPGGWSAGSWQAAYDLEGLLRGDTLTRAQFYASAIMTGWMLRNEARAREGLVPLDGLDEPLQPANTTLIIGGQPQPEQQPPSGGGSGNDDQASAN